MSNIEGETWEELDATEIGHGGQSLRWLVWVRIVPLSVKLPVNKWNLLSSLGQFFLHVRLLPLHVPFLWCTSFTLYRL